MKYQYYDDDKIKSESYFDNFGEPMERLDRKIHRVLFIYDKKGKLTEEKYLDAGGEPLNDTWGKSSLTYIYNLNGQYLSNYCYDTEGRLVNQVVY